MNKTQNYKVSYRKPLSDSDVCEWIVTPNVSPPCKFYEVNESSDGTLSVIVFSGNGLCPALMEGRRLISKFVGVSYL